MLVSAGPRMIFGGGAEELAWKNEGGEGHGKRLGVLRLRRIFCIHFEILKPRFGGGKGARDRWRY